MFICFLPMNLINTYQIQGYGIKHSLSFVAKLLAYTQKGVWLFLYHVLSVLVLPCNTVNIRASFKTMEAA